MGERQRVPSEGREGQAEGALTLRDVGGMGDFQQRSHNLTHLSK